MTEPSAKENLREHLETACEQAEEGKFDEALIAIRTELQHFERSVYLLALEYQVEQLKEYSKGESVNEMQRLDILDSFPGLIEKAVEHPDTTAIRVELQSAPHPDEQEAARRWLSGQYLQHAYRFLIQKEYSRALTEVRRIYILDPANQLARNLETRIDAVLAGTRKNIDPDAV